MMRPLSLLGIFVLARGCMLFGRHVPLSLWVPIAYLWQDLLVVVLFAGLDRLVQRRPWIGWAAYWSLALYIAISVPIARVLSTPLTRPMLRAASGPLEDSIRAYVTPSSIALMIAVIAAAAGLPRLFSRIHLRHLAAGGLVAGLIIFLGPLATTKVETLGLHRNVLLALVTTPFPRVAADSAFDERSDTPAPATDPEDLSRYRLAARGRNVVIVILESAAAEYLRPYGARLDPMPNLTTLAERGLIVENMYTVYPESVKGLLAVLFSRYLALYTRAEDYEALPTPSLAAILREQNYHTGLFHSGRFRYLGMESIIRHRGYDVLEDAGHIGGDHDSSFGIDEASTVRRILAWIDGLPHGDRFFVTYMPIAGHHPYQTPEPGPFPEHQPIDRYRNALHYADASLGDLVRGLRTRGLEDNALLVMVGDHGQAFGQHPGNFGHVLFLYEENVRVPLVVVAPSAIEGPIRVKRIASHVDIAPTVLDLLGLPAPESYQGRSLLDSQSRVALFCTDYSLGWLGLRDQDWKFMYDIEGKRAKLFNLRADPAERQNLADRFPERVTRYREHVLRWSATQRHRIASGR